MAGSAAGFGDTGRACGQNWFHSNIIIGEEHHKPDCTWIDHNHSSGILSAAMQSHMEDFSPEHEHEEAYYCRQPAMIFKRTDEHEKKDLARISKYVAAEHPGLPLGSRDGRYLNHNDVAINDLDHLDENSQAKPEAPLDFKLWTSDEGDMEVTHSSTRKGGLGNHRRTLSELGHTFGGHRGRIQGQEL